VASKFYPRCEKDGNESDLSPLSSVEVKNGWSYSSFSPIHLRDVDMSFTFLRTHFCLPLRVSYSNEKDGDDDDDNDDDDIRG